MEPRPSVKIYYGPYEAHGIIQHRLGKIRAINIYLQEIGYDVEIIPFNHFNRIYVTMKDKQIFRANIKYLKFNMDVEDDPVAVRLIEAIEEARSRMYNNQDFQKEIREPGNLNETLKDLEVEKELSLNDIDNFSWGNEKENNTLS